ncbi:hypothetical protein M0R45_019659 [Rubus argutus]|uniref:Uncharacterized protein n=1 Tax=Rubus argutus TaxID=59490 RepID=A0AAW1X6H5_RUBAR
METLCSNMQNPHHHSNQFHHRNQSYSAPSLPLQAQRHRKLSEPSQSSPRRQYLLRVLIAASPSPESLCPSPFELRPTALLSVNTSRPRCHAPLAAQPPPIS